MKVLHVACGFRPFRINGLIEYAEDLMEIQLTQGYEVGYFFSGRYYPFIRKAWLKKWVRKNITMYEIINSFVFRNSERVEKYPEVDLNEEYSEKFILKILSEFKPDVIHIHELFGIPSSFIEIVKSENIPVLMTLHDYFLLCPTSKLFDYSNSRCLNPDIGDKCKICYSQEIRSYKDFKGETIKYERQRSFVLRKILIKIYYNLLKIRQMLHSIQHTSYKGTNENAKYIFKTAENLDARFQQRRDTNIERLNKIDLLVAPSLRVAEIYSLLGVQADKIKTVNLTVRHLDYIKPKIMTSTPCTINIAVINVLSLIPKGAYLILDTLRILKKAGLTSQFRLVVLGKGIIDDIKKQLLEFDNIVYKGSYTVADLNELLEEIHVGVVPSVWEEVYGFVGIEFLAKGIPVIGNNLGGIVDYTLDNVTGWLNRANTAEGLAQIITDIIHNPNQVLQLNQNIISLRGKIVKSIDKHFDEIDEIYRQLIRLKQKQKLEKINF